MKIGHLTYLPDFEPNDEVPALKTPFFEISWQIPPLIILFALSNLILNHDSKKTFSVKNQRPKDKDIVPAAFAGTGGDTGSLSPNLEALLTSKSSTHKPKTKDGQSA